MDQKQKFNEILNFLKQYYSEVFNLDSESCRFFLNLSNENFSRIDGTQIDPIIPFAPVIVREILENGEDVSQFQDIFGIIPKQELQSSNNPYKGMSEKKRLEVYNFGGSFLRHSEGIDHVVEIACGVGHLSNYMATIVPAEMTITGLDIKPGYLERAQRKAKTLGLHTDFVARDALEDISDLFTGNYNAALALHGCNYLSQRVLKLHDADLLMVSPCCYNGILPKDYFMSEYAGEKVRDSGLVVDSRLGEIAILGPNRMNEAIRTGKIRKIEEQLRDNNYEIGKFDRALLERAGIQVPEVNPENASYVAGMIHELRRKHATLKKLFTKPIEALFSADKAIYLGESGYDNHVYAFMPFSISPRNHLVVGRR
jgi:SAM-dependent methyltransferase